jgi:transcriptional regulator with XRE-family HTH domain
MFKRKELLQSKEYWLIRFQTELYATMETYMKENNLNRTQLAKILGVTKGYISQVLNGNYDHRLSKFIELSLAIKKAPRIRFEDLDKILDDDEMGLLYMNDDSNALTPGIIANSIEEDPLHLNSNQTDHTEQPHDSNKKITTKPDSLVDFLRSSPFVGINLDLNRVSSTSRHIHI